MFCASWTQASASSCFFMTAMTKTRSESPDCTGILSIWPQNVLCLLDSSLGIIMFLYDSHDLLDILLTTQEDGTSLVDLLWSDVKNWNLSISGHSSSILHNPGHRHTLVQHSQLAIRSVSRSGIHENASVL